MPDPHRMVVAVFVCIEQEDSILLVRQGTGDRYWSLPGGVVEAGETLEAAAAREVKEETGFEVRLGHLVGVYSKPSEDALAVTFSGKVTGGHLQADNEILECRFFRYDGLPTHVREHFHQRLADFRARAPEAFVRV